MKSTFDPAIILPLSTVAESDGRHHVIPIMAPFNCDGKEPFHPLIGQILYGRGNMTKEQALQCAAFVCRACNNHAALVSMLERVLHPMAGDEDLVEAGELLERIKKDTK